MTAEWCVCVCVCVCEHVCVCGSVMVGEFMMDHSLCIGVRGAGIVEGGPSLKVSDVDFGPIPNE